MWRGRAHPSHLSPVITCDGFEKKKQLENNKQQQSLSLANKTEADHAEPTAWFNLGFKDVIHVL